MKTLEINTINKIPLSYFSAQDIPPRVEKQVANILQKVKQQGDKAVLNYTAKFDGVKLTKGSIKISQTKLRSAWQKTPSKIKKALNIAKENIQKYHSAQLPSQWKLKLKSGPTLGQLYRPIERIGIYVPGGTAPLVSTVLMTVIPAKVAGVKEIVLVTPPEANPIRDRTATTALGRSVSNGANRYILAAAYTAGVTEVYQAGGAQAIAALAYGTKTIPKVDKIVGPGNIYVTCAKKLVFGTVDIDLLAGPSEVLIIADNTANIGYVTADLLSQLEHDPLSKAVLVTNSNKIYKGIRPEINKQIKKLARKEIISKSIKKGLWIIKVPNLSLAIELTNKIAPEHLELMIKNPKAAIKKIKNAGIILIGPYTPVAASDFLAGTNHVLPTNGTARSFSGLSIWNFLKPIGTVEYTKNALAKMKPYINTFAQIEGLDAHAKSVEKR